MMGEEAWSFQASPLNHWERLISLRHADHRVGPPGGLLANCSSLLAACWGSTSLPNEDCVRQLLPGSGGLCPDGKPMGALCRLRWMAFVPAVQVPAVQGSAGCHDHSWPGVWGYKEHSESSCKLPRHFVPWGLRSLWIVPCQFLGESVSCPGTPMASLCGWKSQVALGTVKAMKTSVS